jgi:type VI secretion system secreted protein Hcp
MAMDQFIKLEGIKGECADKTHKDEIDVLAWSWGVSNSGTSHMGGGGGAGKANFQDLSFTKWVDLSSPKLIELSSLGEHIPTATLVIRKAGGKPLEYMKITMKDCLVTSVSTGGSGGEDRLTENVSLNFAAFEVWYCSQTEAGAQDKDLDFRYNIKQNAAV